MTVLLTYSIEAAARALKIPSVYLKRAVKAGTIPCYGRNPILVALADIEVEIVVRRKGK